MSARALALSYLALWLATIASAALALAGAGLYLVDSPQHALRPTLATLGELLEHNTLIALWPLALVALGWPQLRGARHAGDLLIAGQLLAHGLLVGTALGQHPQLWRFLPHLPLEWLALAIPAGAWLTARTSHDPPSRQSEAGRRLPLVAGAALGALLGAAAIETYLAPL
jgi:hypothetical protein